MLEMLMLLGLGLVAAGAVGMTGIGTDGTASAEAQAATAAHLSEELDAEDGGILAQIRAMGGSLITVTGASGPSPEVAVAASPVPPTEDEPDTQVAETVLEDDTESPEMAALIDRLDGLTGITVTSAAFAGTDDAVTADGDILAGLIQDAPEALAEDEDMLAEDDLIDEVPQITGFKAGEEMLVLMLPEDMDEATSVHIEPAGEHGEDAAVVLEDAQGSVMAAVIKSGYGLITPQDIELQR